MDAVAIALDVSLDPKTLPVKLVNKVIWKNVEIVSVKSKEK
jgi:hypothetical protein